MIQCCASDHWENMWGQYELDERGVSNLVGVILLVAISITGALLILTAGQTTIQDTQNEQNAEVVSDMFKQVDSMFQSVPRNESNSGSRSVAVPESVQGSVKANNDTTYRIRLNDNPTCDTGVQPLGSMQYEEDGTVVGYEGGGVWESREGSTVMESPPALTYKDGSLNVQFQRVSGNITDSNEITAQVNATDERALNDELSVLLYTNLTPSNISSATSYSLTCAPARLQNATVFINDSQFAGGWARYAEDRFNDRRVDVQPSDSVSPRQNVSITFELGDVSLPEFSARNVTTKRYSDTGPLYVNGTVQNEGGLSSEQTVTFTFEDPGGNEVSTDSRDVSLNGGESKRMKFEVPASDLSSVTAGTYDATIETEDESESRAVQFTSGNHVPEFQITSVSAPSQGQVGDDLTVDVTVENRGSMTGTRAVAYGFDGSTENTTMLRLHPGQTKTLSYPLSTTTDGSHDWTVQTDGTSEQGTVFVGTGPTFTISHTDAPKHAGAGNTFWLNATVGNTGQLNGTRDINLTIRNDTNGNVVTDEDQTVSINGTIADSSDEATVNASGTITTPGTYEYKIDTGDMVQTGGFTVGPARYPNFIVTSLRFSDDPVVKGDQVTIEADIKNTGRVDDTQPVRISTERDILTAPNRHVDPGDVVTVSTTVDVASPTFVLGEANEITVETDNNTVAQNLEVLAQEPIGESDDGQIIANERLDVSVRLLGAELEGSNREWCNPRYSSCLGSFQTNRGYQRYGIINDPVEMALLINGQTESDLWQSLPGDGDVNHPEAEQELLNGQNPYNETATLEKDDRAIVTATSYRCSYYQYTDVRFPDLITLGNTEQDAVGKECANRGRTRLSINGNGEDDRVVIRKDGESIRGGEEFEPQAANYQRNVKQMLQGRLNETGHLDLSPGERVLIYELSDRDATIEQASQSGDPDYNDALVLFKVLSKNRTLSPPASYEITDLSAPASVRRGDSETITATINNTGGQEGETDIQFAFGGTTVETESTGELEPGEKTTVTFDVPTGSTGTFGYTVTVADEPTENRAGQLTVGVPRSPHFQVTQFTPDATAVERGETVGIETTITNVGATSDTQTVELRNVTGSNDTVVDTVSGVSLAGNADTTLPLDLPTHTNGTIRYTVSTEDDRAIPQRAYVNESHVKINQTEVGLSTYNESELIERKSVPRMTVKLNNRGGLGDDRDVKLTITNQSDGTTHSDTTTVSVGDGEIKPLYPGYATFDTSSMGISEGYYSYSIEVEDDGAREDYWTGELFVHEDGTVEQSSDSDSPINVDSGQIEVGS
ncbi:DUF7289 family protein [Halomicrobium katesii]